MAQLFASSTSPTAITFDPKGCSGILVGNNRPGIGDPSAGCTWVPGRGGHAISIGQTRSGKGLQIISALTQFYASCVVIDPKGENAWTTAERRRQLGNKVVILDPFDQVNERYGKLAGQLETTTRFNPLSVLDPASPDYSEDVMMLADSIIISSSHDNPHWPDSARQLLAGLISASVENSPPGHASFRQVRKLITATDAELSLAVKSLYERNPDSFAGRNLRRFLGSERVNKKTGAVSYVPSPEIGSIRSTAQTQTAIFESARLLEAMDTVNELPRGSQERPQPFNLRELATGRVTLFLVLPVNRLQSYGRWLRMILTLAINAITSAPRPPDPPVLFLLDELGTINPGGGLQMIRQAYGLMAGMGIRVWGFLQDIKQLQDDYPTAWESFFANCEMIQILNVNDNSTAQYFSTFMGSKATPLSMGPDRLDPLFRPDQIKELSLKNESLLLFSGGRNFRMSKVNYFADPRLVGRFRPNPQFPASPVPEPLPAWKPSAPVTPARQPPNLGRVVIWGMGAFACFAALLIALKGMGF